MARGDGKPGPSVPVEGVAKWAVEDLLILEVDNTSDANYTFFSYTYDLNAALTDKVWQVKRISTATGSVRFAKDPATGKATNQFMLQASEAANYSY